MDFKEFRRNLTWGVAVTFTIAQLLLLPIGYYYVEQRTTVEFLIWFLPWFCAFVFTLIFLGSWLWEQKHREKWIVVGKWESFQGSDRFEGHIPNWIKKRIPSIFSPIWIKELNKIKDSKTRMKFMLQPFECVKTFQDKHYLYKLVFNKGDEIDSIVIYRKSRSSSG